MKKLLLLATVFAVTCSAFAQNVDLRRKIEVSGTAEQEVTPDIINVSIALQEYMNGKNKITIDVLENQLENAVKEAGITKDDFTVNNVSAYNNYYQKKKNPDFLASKQYSIRFHDLDKFNRILGQLDPKGILSTNIDSYDYSKIAVLKRDLKIQALLDAKEKASYLLNSIGEKLGGVIDITEIDNNNNQGFVANRAVSYSAMAPVSDIDFKKIKLTFRINAVFEIGK
ncbi:MAG TPA: SIMPL domain-containing protein [Mucilaginibacter sp.]